MIEMITIIFKESGEKIYERYMNYYYEGPFFVINIDGFDRDIWPANSIWKIEIKRDVNDDGVHRS